MAQSQQPEGKPPGEAPEVPVYYVSRQTGIWSRRKAAIVGALVGAFFGLIFFAAYGVTSAWICSGVRSCPGSWQPFAIVSGIGWVGAILFGAFIGYFIRGLYRLFKVT